MKKYTVILLILVLLMAAASPALAQKPEIDKYEETSGYAFWFEGEWGDEEVYMTDLWFYRQGKDTIVLFLYKDKGTWVEYDEPECYESCYEDECFEWCEEGYYEWEVLLDSVYEIPASDFSTTPNFKKGSSLLTEAPEGTISVTWEEPVGYENYSSKGTHSFYHFRANYKSEDKSAYGMVCGSIFGEDMGQGWGSVGTYSSIYRFHEGNPNARFKAVKPYAPKKVNNPKPVEQMGYAYWMEGTWEDEVITVTDLWLYQVDKENFYLYLVQGTETWVPYDEPICYVYCFDDGECIEWCEYGEYVWEVILDKSYLIPASSFSTSNKFKNGAELNAETEDGAIRVVWDRPTSYYTSNSKGTRTIHNFKLTYLSKSIYADGQVHGWIFGEEMGQGWGGVGSYSSIYRVKEKPEKKF